MNVKNKNVIVTYILFFITISILICYRSKISCTISKPVVAIILPITTKGNNNSNPLNMLLVKYFYPSLLNTIQPNIYKYKLFIGYSYDDPHLSDRNYLNKLIKLLSNNIIEVYTLFTV